MDVHATAADHRSTLGEPEERVYTGWQALGYHDAQAGYVCGIFPRRAVLHGSVR